MKASTLLTSLLPLLSLACFTAPAIAAPPEKVQVCHIPPDDPENFRTLMVSERALSTHLAHGDLAGACANYCESLCDDGDLCTVDGCDDNEKCSYGDVDCDDGNVCTEDQLCDPQTGCLNEPLHETPCDDGDPGTEDDECTAGICSGSRSCPCFTTQEVLDVSAAHAQDGAQCSTSATVVQLSSGFIPNIVSCDSSSIVSWFAFVNAWRLDGGGSCRLKDIVNCETDSGELMIDATQVESCRATLLSAASVLCF